VRTFTAHAIPKPTHVNFGLDIACSLGHFSLKSLPRMDSHVVDHRVGQLPQHPVLVFLAQKSLKLIVDVIGRRCCVSVSSH